jgi:hypothetical protein
MAGDTKPALEKRKKASFKGQVSCDIFVHWDGSDRCARCSVAKAVHYVTACSPCTIESTGVMQIKRLVAREDSFLEQVWATKYVTLNGTRMSWTGDAEDESTTRSNAAISSSLVLSNGVDIDLNCHIIVKREPLVATQVADSTAGSVTGGAASGAADPAPKAHPMLGGKGKKRTSMNVSWSAGLDLMSKQSTIGSMNPMLNNPMLAQRYAGNGTAARKGSWVHVGQSLKTIPDQAKANDEGEEGGTEGYDGEEGGAKKGGEGGGGRHEGEGYVFTITCYQQAVTFKCDTQQDRDAFITLFRAVQQYVHRVMTQRLEEAATADLATGEYSVADLSVKQLKTLLKHKAVSMVGASEKGDLQALVRANATSAEIEATMESTLGASNVEEWTEIAVLRARARMEVPSIQVASNVSKLGLLHQKLTGQVVSKQGGICEGSRWEGHAGSRGGSSANLLQSSRSVLHAARRGRGMGRGASGRFGGPGGSGRAAGGEPTAAAAVDDFIRQGNGRNILKLMRKLRRVSQMSVAVAKDQGEALVAILLAIGEQPHGLQALIGAQIDAQLGMERGVIDESGGAVAGRGSMPGLHTNHHQGGRGSSMKPMGRVGSSANLGSVTPPPTDDTSLYTMAGPAAGLFKAMLDVALGISTLGSHDALKHAVTLLFRAAVSGARGLSCVMCVFNQGKRQYLLLGCSWANSSSGVHSPCACIISPFCCCSRSRRLQRYRRWLLQRALQQTQGPNPGHLAAP